jgi:hypothetical protein
MQMVFCGVEARGVTKYFHAPALGVFAATLIYTKYILKR